MDLRAFSNVSATAAACSSGAFAEGYVIPKLLLFSDIPTNTHYCLNYEDFDFIILMHLLGKPYSFLQRILQCLVCAKWKISSSCPQNRSIEIILFYREARIFLLSFVYFEIELMLSFYRITSH